jgi:hypothetical protein
MQLQGNSWLWEVAGLQILVDPVLVGNLDFGIPFLYDAAKKSKLMKEYNVRETIIICLLLLLCFQPLSFLSVLHVVLSFFYYYCEKCNICALQMNCGHVTGHFDSKKICWVFIDRGVGGFVCGSLMICHHSTAYS